ncbi:hypothetical protein KKI24_28845 [bacterium]|nr:hypothetical protein [bacterium]
MSEEPKTVKVIVENHQRGNRQFPGWKKKYPKLYDIPGETSGANAIIVEVEEGDLEKVKSDCLAEGVSVRDFESLDDKSKSFFGKVFSLFGGDDDDEGKDPTKELVKQWYEVFKKLDKKDKNSFKDFEPKKASVEEIQAKIAEVQKLITPEK